MDARQIKILVVEDDNEINQLLCEIITGIGYDPQPVFSGTEALLYLARKQEWSMMLLDLMLPGLSGEEILQQLGEERQFPVIIISAKGEQQTKVSILRMGADDFITKPFDIEEVSARIDAHLRRYRRTLTKDPIGQITYKDIHLNLDTKMVLVNGADVILTAREFTVLELLMSYPKKVFTKPNLFEAVWGDAYLGDDNTITVHMSNLRRKLAQANPEAEYIETLWGMGYRLK
ncbi:response regulator transcription factor [Paenibacillus crassostreae]|uniref:XRE family transcriptional regulator n=1 Tax=Paenibacillus crassostreae TaxID=1763538 RepID=A0A162KPZ6_9BACL|nr:response regulator transcription factor [Paenibacillus crassostreae]AOZ92907.1 DNA-binding response regulator [Paenibacillus crassostreae]OAB72003.1 XRE family transcriptional regulator [Paenibacillus crassostreae]